MSNKTYYKTTFTITVLSEGPYTYSDLESLRHDVEDGDCIGKIETNSSDPLTAEQMRAALLDAGNDGTFFNLDKDDQIVAGTEVENEVDATICVKVTTLLLFARNDAVSLDDVEEHAKGCFANELDNGSLAFWDGDDAPEGLEFLGSEIEVYAD